MAECGHSLFHRIRMTLDVRERGWPDPGNKAPARGSFCKHNPLFMGVKERILFVFNVQSCEWVKETLMQVEQGTITPLPGTELCSHPLLQQLFLHWPLAGVAVTRQKGKPSRNLGEQSSIEEYGTNFWVGNHRLVFLVVLSSSVPSGGQGTEFCKTLYLAVWTSPLPHRHSYCKRRKQGCFCIGLPTWNGYYGEGEKWITWQGNAHCKTLGMLLVILLFL